MATFLRMALQASMIRTSNIFRSYTTITMLTGGVIGGISSTSDNSNIVINDNEITGYKKTAIMSITGAVTGPILVPAIVSGYMFTKVGD